jgi:hypothetical protein
MNEYEVLQLLMGECRERLAEYKGNLEEEIKGLQVCGWGTCALRRRPGRESWGGHLFALRRLRYLPRPWATCGPALSTTALIYSLMPCLRSAPPCSQSPDLQGHGRLAARLRKCEKTILTQFMDAVRRKLAPVRGIPTKSGGMQDPNADLKEIFDTIEAIPSAPARLFDGIRRWARGDFDPEWKK